MSASIYDLKLVEPNVSMLQHDLRDTKLYFDKIVLFIKENYGDLSLEWKFYGKKSGWVLKMISGKRNILFVIPCKGYFKTVFTFAGKAFEAILTTSLNDMIKQEVRNAKKYAEGRTIQLEVKTEEHQNDILELIRIKLAN